MNSATVLQEVTSFFASEEVAGLILPNGWFGKPDDNWHRLTDARLVGEVMTIELDERLTLTLAGPTTAHRSGSALRLSGFTTAEWLWKEYGSDKIRHELFRGGEVDLIGLAR
jgi:hypothetical protein